MGLVDRVLTILNELVLLLWQLFIHTLFVLVPRPVRRLLRFAKFGLRWLAGGLWKVCLWGGRLIKEFSIKVATPFIRFQSAFQEVIGALVDQIKSIKTQDLTPGNLKKKLIQLVVTLLGGVVYMWKMTWGNMSNATIATICSLGCVMILAGWQIYTIGDNLYLQIAHGGRKPASEFEQKSTLKRRPVYYKQETRHYEIKQMRIPVYIEAQNSVKIFEVDVTIEASNRFVRRFFSENENLIRDRMLSTTEPMVHNFPLSDEGKQVMKEKITYELDQFIKENEMNGDVTQIYFTSIVAL